MILYKTFHYSIGGNDYIIHVSNNGSYFRVENLARVDVTTLMREFELRDIKSNIIELGHGSKNKHCEPRPSTNLKDYF